MNRDELKELQDLNTKASNGEWSYCCDDRGGCQCGMIWDISLDTTVMQACGYNEDCPDIAEAQQKINMAFITKLRNKAPELLEATLKLQDLEDALAWCSKTQREVSLINIDTFLEECRDLGWKSEAIAA